MNKYQTQENKIGITLQQYSLLKKYISGIPALLYAYNSLINTGKVVHRNLVSQELHEIILKENIVMSIFNKVSCPFSNVLESDLTVTASPENLKKYRGVTQHINSLINKGYIINCYSEVGEQANMLATYLTEMLIGKGYKGISTSGIGINKTSVDFENSNSINDLLVKDFLTIFSANSVLVTDFRKNFLENLYTQAKLDKKPIILSSKTEFKDKSYNVINIKLNEQYKNEMELISELSDQVPELPEKKTKVKK